MDFTPPAVAFTVSADVLPGATNTGGCAIGFTSNMAQVTNNFFTSKSEGGGGKSRIDVLRGPLWLRSWATKHGNELALAVGPTARTIGLLSVIADIGAEYTQAGVYTGVDYPMPLGANPSVQFLDGASDGQTNYVVDFNNNVVYACDANWANPVVLFTLTNMLARAGITHDPSNNSLWLGGFSSSVVENRALDGTLLSSFTVGHAGNAALALDPADGTLWLHNQANLSGTFEQYSGSGTLLMTQSFTNLISRGVLGAEFLPPPRPTTLRSPVRTSSGHYQFIIDGVPPGKTNVVQTSPDLTNWTTLLSTNVPLSTQVPIDDPTATNAVRFYRSFERH